MSKFLGGIAAEVYAQQSGGNDIQSFIPRSKFQFTVSLTHINPDGASGLKTLVLTRISTIDMPSHTVRTATLNQYNRKRIIQTGIDYNVISMNAYDTRDAEIEKFLVQYSNYYYTNVMGTADSQVYNDDVITSDFLSGFSASGFKLQSDRNFIKDITITRKSSDDDVNVIKIYNPIISSVGADNLDYSSSEPVQYRIEFQYEGYEVVTNGNTISNNTNSSRPENAGEETTRNENTPQKGSTQSAEESRPKGRPLTREDIVDPDGQIRESVVTNNGVKRLTKSEIAQGKKDGSIKRSIANKEIKKIEQQERYLKQLEQ